MELHAFQACMQHLVVYILVEDGIYISFIT